MGDLHFQEIEGCDISRFQETVEPHLRDDTEQILLDIAESLDGAMQLGAAYLDGTLYVRIYDGQRYLFPLPFALVDGVDTECVCLSLARYAAREMIPLLITDVPREELDGITSTFRYVDAWCYEEDDDCFAVRVSSECDALDAFPSITLDGVTLDEIREQDEEAYAALCRDGELNRYWGYDVSADNPEGVSRYYLDTARRELSEGIAVTLAVRESQELVGEAVIYGFDYRGGASLAVRILPTHQGRGIGRRALSALVAVAREIGLLRVRTQIMNDNAASIAMTARVMRQTGKDGERTYFELEL